PWPSRRERDDRYPRELSLSQSKARRWIFGERARSRTRPVGVSDPRHERREQPAGAFVLYEAKAPPWLELHYDPRRHRARGVRHAPRACRRRTLPDDGQLLGIRSG